MGTLKVNGAISATGTISASSFLGNASSATYTCQFRISATNPCTASTDSNIGIFNVPDSRIYWITQTGTVIDQLSQWGYILDIGNNAERHQIWMTQSSGDMAHRGSNASGWSGTWRVLLDSSNYTSYVPTKTGSGASGTWGINITGTWQGYNPSSFALASHSHSYLPLSGGTMSGSPVIKFPGSAGSIAASDPMAITYGRISAYGTLCINANTDNSGTEYIILTAGKGLSSSTTDGLAIGTSTLTWQGATVLTTGNFPSSSSLARQTDMWISAASLDVNTYYPVVISLPGNGLNRIKLAVQLNSSTKPSWSTHNAGFTSNIDVEIIQAGWGTVSPLRYLLRQDDYGFSSVKPAYFAGQLSNASLAVFYVRGGGSYRFICDWADASISLRTSSTTYNEQTVAPTTSTSIFHSGSKSHLYCNVDYASSAGNATTCNGIQLEWSGSIAWDDTAWIAAWNSDGSKIKALNKDNFAPASHSHSYASLASPNNMIHSGNEYTFVPEGYSGVIWLNYRAGWSTNGNIGSYVFGNGKGSTAPIEHLYDITHNYGSGAPGSSTPGYGTAGAIYYKT